VDVGVGGKVLQSDLIQTAIAVKGTPLQACSTQLIYRNFTR
jgi:hypothetical protein